MHLIRPFPSLLYRMQRLKELIGEQTNIPPQDQLLLVGGQKLNTLVQPNQPVREYHMDISATNPVVVYSTKGTFPQRPYTPSVGESGLLCAKLKREREREIS